MTFKEFLSENVLDKIGRKLNIKTTIGKPDLKDAPKWAKYLGQTPEGSYHWLSNKSEIENDSSDKYFPDAEKEEFTGFVGKKGKGAIEKI